MSEAELLYVAGLSDINRFYQSELEPLLIERVPGTEGSDEARRVSRLKY